MNIAELFVRVRADVTDVNRRMRDIEGALGGVDRASKSAGLQTGRLGNQFANLAGRIAHVHPVVGNLAGVLGNFAIGAGLTVGVLAGVAAVAVAYDKLTAASRKAMEAGDKLIESYVRQARISALGIAGQQKADIEDINKGLEQHNKWLGFIIAARIQLGSLGGIFGKDPGGHAKQLSAGAAALGEATKQQAKIVAEEAEKAAKKAQDAADKMAAAMRKAQQDFLAGISSGIAVFDNLASHGTSSSAVNAKLIEDYGKLASQIREMGNASGPAVAELLRLRDALAANLVVAREIARVNSTGTVGPLVGKTLPGVSITPSGAIPTQPMPKVGSPSDPIVEVGDQVQLQLQKDAEQAAQNAQMIASAIGHSAHIIGQAVVSALNIGGGGKGAALGGALGGTAGAVGGMILGAPGGALGIAIGSAIGSTVGTLIGSALGGLFGSNTKATNANTAATRENTAVMALLLNAPSVYKVAAGRFDATDVKAFRRASIRYATRGGAPILVTP